MAQRRDDDLEEKQGRMIDYIDGAENPLDVVDGLIEQLKAQATMPQSHPSEYMRWLWDYCLMRKAELLHINNLST